MKGGVVNIVIITETEIIMMEMNAIWVLLAGNMVYKPDISDDDNNEWVCVYRNIWIVRRR